MIDSDNNHSENEFSTLSIGSYLKIEDKHMLQLRDIEIDTLQLNSRASNILKREELYFILDITENTPVALYEVPLIGPIILKNIGIKLFQYLHFKFPNEEFSQENFSYIFKFSEEDLNLALTYQEFIDIKNSHRLINFATISKKEFSLFKQISIKDLDINSKALFRLQRSNIRSIYTLIHHSEDDLLQIGGIGQKTLTKILTEIDRILEIIRA